MGNIFTIDETNKAQIDQKNGAVLCSQSIITKLPTSVIKMPPLRPQEWMLMFSGIALIPSSFQGSNDIPNAATLRILLDFSPPFAYSEFKWPPGTEPFLDVQQYTTFATLNSVYMTVDSPRVPGGGDRLSNPIFTIEAFRPFFPGGGRVMPQGSGIEVDVSVHDPNASLMGVGYQMTLVGTLGHRPVPPIA